MLSYYNRTMKIPKIIAKPILYTFTAGSILTGAYYSNAQAQTSSKSDSFEMQATAKKVVPPEGTNDLEVLANAPNPEITVAGKVHNAEIVVDVQNNVLYHYNEDGTPRKAYLVATGAPTSPTHSGIRFITNIEHSPYKTAPASTKRHKQPWLFGKHAIILDKVDTITGERNYFGEFIHGTNQESSIGKKVSGGCMRMSKEAIEELSKIVKTRRYVRVL